MTKNILIFLVLIFIFSSNMFSKSILTFYYFERPPYYFTDKNGNPAGILNNIAKNIIRKTDIQYCFQSVPSKRILLLLKSHSHSCSTSWFFTKERAKIYKYSLPIYESKPIVALINKNKWIQGKNKISSKKLFNMKLTFGIKSGFNYGKILGNEFKKHKNKIFSYTVATDNLMKMVALVRIDVTFFSLDNAKIFLNSHKKFSNRISIVHLEEIKKGIKRYIICSQDVPEKIIAKLNNTIKELKYDR